jgi:alpha-amylase
LDHHNPELRQALKDWLNWLHKDMGYGGWRLDFVKGYAANYAGEYIKDTIGEKAFHVGVRYAAVRLTTRDPV